MKKRQFPLSLFLLSLLLSFPPSPIHPSTHRPPFSLSVSVYLHSRCSLNGGRKLVTHLERSETVATLKNVQTLLYWGQEESRTEIVCLHSIGLRGILWFWLFKYCATFRWWWRAEQKKNCEKNRKWTRCERCEWRRSGTMIRWWVQRFENCVLIIFVTFEAALSRLSIHLHCYDMAS